MQNAIQFEPKIRIGTLAGPLTEFAREKNRRFEPDLRFIRERKSSEDTIPLGLFFETLEQIEKASFEGALLLRTGSRQDLGDIGVLGKAIIHSERLWDALDAAMAGVSYLVDQVEMKIRFRFGRCRVEYLHSYPDCPGADLDTQYSTAAIYNVVSQAVWTPSANMVIGIPGAEPRHRDLFPLAQLVTDSKFGMIEFDESLLKSPMKGTNVKLSLIAHKMMEMSDMTSQHELDIPGQVRGLQLAALKTTYSAINLKVVSYFLGLSTRTLQHTLNRSGTSFAALKAEARHEIARDVLRSGRTISETASLIGYTQRQTFSSAFSEWEGMSPSEFASRG